MLICTIGTNMSTCEVRSFASTIRVFSIPSILFQPSASSTLSRSTCAFSDGTMSLSVSHFQFQFA